MAQAPVAVLAAVFAGAGGQNWRALEEFEVLILSLEVASLVSNWRPKNEDMQSLEFRRARTAFSSFRV
ncbi:hypothetical protein RchiOBHm_Chr5g0049561 [Rosa chinensis]|uniref:Uncharacterized protein n=1 Tax=Rosa chinensis TaxID=74649 RepID=A0A2P6QEW5_ROSCH|nr:hypothetical protein RchiOBHm_Chr5g0049561 [Rosa chinensis]